MAVYPTASCLHSTTLLIHVLLCFFCFLHSAVIMLGRGSIAPCIIIVLLTFYHMFSTSALGSECLSMDPALGVLGLL